MRKLAWCLFLILVLSIPAVAGVGVWTPVGGIEPPYSRLVVDPGDPETLYALVLGRDPEGSNSLWRTTDGGATWTSIQNGIPPVSLLAVDPLQPGRLYAWDVSDYSQPKLWVSEDRGESWTLRFAAVPNSEGPYLWQVLASPIRRGVLYGWSDPPGPGLPSFGATIYRSADGGATWTRRGTVGTSRVSIESLLHHPTRNLLEYFDNVAFYVSHDNGLTWTVRSTFRDEGFRFVTRSDAAPDRLYAIPMRGGPCVLRSDDGGTNWKRTRRPAFRGNLFCTYLAVDPADPDLIRVTAEGLVGRQRFVRMISTSRDGGATWSEPRAIPSDFPLVTGADPDTIYAAGGNGNAAPGPYRSTDDGRTWTLSWDGIAAGDLRGGLVALPGSGGNPLLVSVAFAAGVAGGRIARSVDGGATWELPAVPGEYRKLEGDANGTLYALRSDNGRVMRSTDGGLRWVEATPGGGSIFLLNLFADPFQPGRLFGLTETTSGPTRVDVWRTADAGRTWARRNAGLPVTCRHIASVDICPSIDSVTSDPRQPERVLMAFGGDGSGFFIDVARVYISTNGGRRWQLAAQSPPEMVLSLAADPETPGVFLAGTETKLFRSQDGGNHWTEVRPGLPVLAPVLQLFHDDSTGAWYAVTNVAGIYRSTDGGNTWADISDGLPDLVRPVAAVDPQNPGRLFAAVRGQGLWSWSAPGS